MAVLQRALLASLALLASAWATQAQEATIRIGLVKSISNAANLWAIALPPERLVDTSYIREAVAKLGPFVLENNDSKLPGCR